MGSGDTYKYQPYPESQATRDGLFGPMHHNATSMGDIDTNLFQLQETHGNVNNTVAQQAGPENRTSRVQNNNSVHTMNCRERTNEKKKSSANRCRGKT